MAEPAIPELGIWPTPVQRVDSVPGVYVKREDLSGVGFGGSKVRVWGALAKLPAFRRADTLVTGGRWDSNWGALSVLAARALGIAAHVVFDPVPQGREPSSAIRLTTALGGTAHVLDRADTTSVSDAIAVLAGELRRGGRRVVAVDRAGRDTAGVHGYAAIVHELRDQLGAGPLRMVVPIGSGGLAAGLLLGMRRSPAAATLIGVAVTTDAVRAEAKVRQLVGEACPGTDPAELLRPLTVLDRHPWPLSADRAATLRAIVDAVCVLPDPVFVRPAWETFAARCAASGERTVLVASGGLPAYLDGLRAAAR